MCIHCQNMKPEWELLKNKLKKIKSKCALLEIDSNYLDSIENAELKNNIKGFPSILLFKNGKLLKEFSGDRTSNMLYNFLKPYFSLDLTRKSKKKKSKRINIIHKIKTIRNKKIIKLKDNIGLCRHAKYRNTGCKVCCSQFKKRKTYKKCMKKCAK